MCWRVSTSNRMSGARMSESAPAVARTATVNSENQGAWCVSIAVFVIMTVKTVFPEFKYAVYSLPFLIPAIYMVVERGRLPLYRSGLICLLLYVGFALGSLLHNGPTGFFTYRDLLIIGGYLFLFTVYVRFPPLVADMAMATLGVGLAIAAAKHGVRLSIDFSKSVGLIESTLAFPLGIVFLYYFHERKWVRSLIAVLLLFVAFKRIALFAVVIAVFLDVAFRLVGARGINKFAALGFVIVFSLMALLSEQIFAFYAEEVATSRMSANEVSLGRWQHATLLWDHIASHGWSHTVMGFGPGAADDLVNSNDDSFDNPHNDWLKLFFDYGIIGFISAHAILFILFSRNSLGLMIYIYTAILMMTDNVLIYIFYFVYIFLIIRIGLKDRKPLLRYQMNEIHNCRHRTALFRL